ncbi:MULTISPECIES: lactate utilization protein [unclassified Pseudomonas]|uniref:LutC/YkgG family protein n=1 Tax=unclassified Pseudomonas TaxID=196821 RepID=UPI000BDA1F42|nr:MULTISPECIES: lactate utilization protein [unclassified Pseudomonas]PVZ12609.1 L-lactate dehydrogenase complex protein LldG [Pseudomonas sp. URIL14HWK12:I12]PVZ23239.1 L-lactate dehydrogenase complex protein LldG [Pseudomonas sp. URIL14HWK12:I10]PVZ32569.1 L-lactate dehydrogenase complex protein LldG [Pseudomonas sp. URIL14HWK12:I11]SNZ13686.1 L-lactate dehydrogenase complex protein LldG [Pseudomonas sp. URIL14HWK12:I9]
MSARDNILARLRKSLEGTTPITPNFDPALVTEPWQYPPHERVSRLKTLMEAVHTQVHLSHTGQWPALLVELLQARGIDRLLVSPRTAHGQQLAEHVHAQGHSLLLKGYDQPVEAWKHTLFNDTPASLTGTLGAIAATGSLVLWPTPEEPRLMSLVPPVHIALLKASEVHDNFYSVQRDHGWAQGMPTNALLISGPSKTADIEQVLAYGAHGPKDLIVIILEDA